MTDAVTTQVLLNAAKYVVCLTNLSDGTGEAAVKKVDLSELSGQNGEAVSGLQIDRVDWTVQGFGSVKLAWDHTADDVGVILGNGVGSLDFRASGRGLQDPGSAGGTGDIVLTAPSGASGASYSILLTLSKQQ